PDARDVRDGVRFTALAALAAGGDAPVPLRASVYAATGAVPTRANACPCVRTRPVRSSSRAAVRRRPAVFRARAVAEQPAHRSRRTPAPYVSSSVRNPPRLAATEPQRASR